MKLLLDTQIVLWALADDARLRAAARVAMQEADELLVSAVSIWEVSIKSSLGKLRAPADLVEIVRRTGMHPLPITWEHAASAGLLPPHHSDPFDRLLIAQAQIERLRILTEDRAFAAYEVDLV